VPAHVNRATPGASSAACAFVRACRVGQDAPRPPDHLVRGAPREGEQQNALGCNAIEHEVRDAVRQRIRLARASARNDKQRRSMPDAVLTRIAVRCGRALSRIELLRPLRAPFFFECGAHGLDYPGELYVHPAPLLWLNSVTTRPKARRTKMKLLYFNDFRLGVLKDDKVVDVMDVVRDIPHTGPHNLINGLIERFASYRGKLEQAAASGKGLRIDEVRIRPPLPKPHNIDCMAVNYMEDGTREAPAPINAFHKSPSAIIGYGDTMVLPDVPATIFEGEAEVALVIGKRACNVRAADAMGYIFGYMNFIDGSARGLPPSGNTFYQMKSRETFAPIGPYIVTCGRDPRSSQAAGQAVGEWGTQAELQHERHGAQDSALHRVGELDSHDRTRRHPRDRHESPRSERVSGRRHDRDRK
jgi:2-keto-4-pentenoate hydratase/2-oxohepta-3-ene-1,7-dioic acid hydratase in catechol pathway